MGDKKQYAVVKLLKNHLYPTYQLYAKMNNHKLTAREGLIYGALTVLSWLRRRLGETDVPGLLLPEPENYRQVGTDSLVSLHINHGFVIDIIFLPEKGIWSLQITEPDLGSNPGTENQLRQPVAGRIIETNVGFAVVGEELALGVQTVISDPEHAARAEVYRPAFVRKLFLDPNFGLCHVLPLVQEPYYVNTDEQLANMLNLWHNPEQQLPFVVFTEERKLQVPPGQRSSYLTLADLGKDPKGKFTGVFDHKFQGALPGEPKGPVRDAKLKPDKLCYDFQDLKINYLPPSFDVARFAGFFTAYSRTFVLGHNILQKFADSVCRPVNFGDIIFLEPLCFGGAVQILAGDDRVADYARLCTMTQNYARDKDWNFEGIHFLGGARDALIKRASELRQQSTEQAKAWDIEKNLLEQRWQARLNEKDLAISRLENQLHKLEQQLNVARQRALEAQALAGQQQDRHQVQLRLKDEYIAYLQRRLGRPHTKKELAEWIRGNFGDRIYLHPRAEQLLEQTDVNQNRLELIYDALEFLATDYWEYRYQGLSDDEFNNRMAQKYQRRFLVTQVGDMTIDFGGEQYKVQYTLGGGKAVNCRLDYHLKIGNKAEHLVRIYFFHDEERQLIVVGSLPEHLDCAKMS